MKKIAFLLAFCALGTTGAFAQSSDIAPRSSTDYPSSTGTNGRTNSFGIKGGWNSADFRGDDKKNYSDDANRQSFHAGVFARFGLSDHTALQFETLYSRQGFKAASSFRPAGMTNTYTTSLDYVQIPVMFVYQIVDNVSVHVGPQVSLLVNAKEGDKTVNIADRNYNSLDYGAVAGLEAKVGPAVVGGRYVLGLGDIYNDPKTLSVNGTDYPIAQQEKIDNIKNGVIQVYVGFGLGL